MPDDACGGYCPAAPCGEEESPALSRSMLEGYGLQVLECNLTQVVRQAGNSGILCNATLLRMLITQEDCFSLPKIRLKGFPDVKMLPEAN